MKKLKDTYLQVLFNLDKNFIEALSKIDSKKFWIIINFLKVIFLNH